MQAPEDNIDFNNKSVVYENKTYRKFERLINIYKYWDLAEGFILFLLLLGATSLTPYLIDILLLFESDYSGTFIYVHFIENYGQVVFYVILLIASFQIYKSIENRNENQKLGARFYVFQSIKIFIYLWTKFNLLLFFAIIGMVRIGLIIYFSRTKSFK